MSLQWQVWKDNFITFKANVGKVTANRSDLLIWDDMVVGYGASFGYRSPIGPMEITLMSSNRNKGLSYFINIGYWF
jgi:outer membrane translocation and assembly module TamA